MCVEYPSYLKNEVMDKLDIDEIKFNLLYSTYNFPNMILPLIGGYIVDKMGYRIGNIIFSSFLCIG